MIRKPYAVWSDLDGVSGTFKVGIDEHEGIQTKIVIFNADSGVNYVLAEYQKKITTPQSSESKKE